MVLLQKGYIDIWEGSSVCFENEAARLRRELERSQADLTAIVNSHQLARLARLAANGSANPTLHRCAGALIDSGADGPGWTP